MLKTSIHDEKRPKRSKQLGFTVTELLIVVAIIAVVAAITLPVLRGVRRSSLETSAKSALRQNWLALELYRNEWGGGLEYGSTQQLALPLDTTNFKFPQKPPFRNPAVAASGYLIYPKEEGVSSPALVEEWVRYSKQCLSSSILLGDFNFNDFDPWQGQTFTPKKGIGVLLGGSIATRIREGAPNNPFWWDCGQPE